MGGRGYWKPRARPKEYQPYYRSGASKTPAFLKQGPTSARHLEPNIVGRKRSRLEIFGARKNPKRSRLWSQKKGAAQNSFFARWRKRKPMSTELEPLELNAEKTSNTVEPSRSPSSKSSEPVWRSRCCTPEGTVVTKSLMTFSLTSLISVIVLCFSLYMLTTPELDDSMKTLYISLVSSISSLHVPSPLQKLWKLTNQLKIVVVEKI